MWYESVGALIMLLFFCPPLCLYGLYQTSRFGRARIAVGSLAVLFNVTFLIILVGLTPFDARHAAGPALQWGVVGFFWIVSQYLSSWEESARIGCAIIIGATLGIFEKEFIVPMVQQRHEEELTIVKSKVICPCIVKQLEHMEAVSPKIGSLRAEITSTEAKIKSLEAEMKTLRFPQQYAQEVVLRKKRAELSVRRSQLLNSLFVEIGNYAVKSTFRDIDETIRNDPEAAKLFNWHAREANAFVEETVEGWKDWLKMLDAHNGLSVGALGADAMRAGFFTQWRIRANAKIDSTCPSIRNVSIFGAPRKPVSSPTQ